MTPEIRALAKRYAAACSRLAEVAVDDGDVTEASADAADRAVELADAVLAEVEREEVAR